MLYIFYKKNKTHLCFKSASVLQAEGGGKCYKCMEHVPSRRALLFLLPERVRRVWGAEAPRTEAVEAVTMALGENRCCLLSHKSEAGGVCSPSEMSQATAF